MIEAKEMDIIAP